MTKSATLKEALLLTLNVLTFFLALASLLLWFWPVSVAAIVGGHVVRWMSRGRPDWHVLRLVPRWTLGFAYCGLVLAIYLAPIRCGTQYWFDKDAPRRSSCANNLKQMGIVFKMFSNESKGGVFPAVSPEAGELTLDLYSDSPPWSVYPEYLTDLKVLLCPSDPASGAYRDKLDGEEPYNLPYHSYIYLGYAVTNDQELRAFAAAYRACIASDRPFDEYLETEDGYLLYRLREGVEGHFTSGSNDDEAASASAEIPVMWDRVTPTQSNHEPGGANVLYLDGHVEFIKYPGKFPMTEEALRIMAELETMDENERTVDHGWHGWH